MDNTVLCYIEKDNKYLILYRNKKKHDINKGKYIGIGGHIENNESADDALLREVKEETGLSIVSYNHRGRIYFKSDDYEEIMELYTSSSFYGELVDCNEGTLMWIDKIELLSLNIWEGDKIFLKLLQETNDFFELELIYKNGKLIKQNRLI